MPTTAFMRPKSVASDFLLKVLVTFALCSLNSPVPIERNNMLYHEVPGSIPGPATQNKVFMNLFHGYLVSLLFILDLFFFSYRITFE